MRITILQTDAKWACPDVNVAAAEALIESAPQSDLYVLPEMWATGFAATTPDVACTNAPLRWMQIAAKRKDAAVCGGGAVKEDDGTYRNRLYFVTPDGMTEYYDKRHLFTPGGEHLHYTPGSRRIVVNYRGVRFLLLTCYDLRFPAWMRYDGDYDAIIFAANWPESRQEVWLTLLKARAIENQCYVIGANRIGHDPQCAYTGGSAIITPKGNIIATDDRQEAQTVTADIDMEELRNFRAKFPVLDDRDTVMLT